MTDRPFFDLIGNLLEYEDEDTIATATDEAKKFISSTKSARTKEITDNDAHSFKSSLRSQGESREPFQIDVALLGAYLSKYEYIQQMKGNDGEEYEPQTIKGAVYSIERYLKEHGYDEWKIITSPAFSVVQDVLKAKMTISKSSGKGNRPNTAMPRP